MRARVLLLSAMAALLTMTVLLQVWRDRGWQPYEPVTPVMWLQDPEVMRRLSLGFDSLVADGYWMRAVIYFGRQRLSTRADKNYDLLYPLLNLVTALDPRFTAAYRFGSVFLSEPPPGGPGRPDQAIELLLRGWRATPERWEYLHDLGFVHYWSYRDYPEAARWFARAADIEGAPYWLRSTAASMIERGGDRESARELWRHLAETVEFEAVRREAETRLRQFDALDAIDLLNPIVWRYQARTGRMPQDWQELIAARVLRGVPRDPAGVPFVLDQVNEDVRLARESPLWPLPEDVQQQPPP